MIRNPRSHRNSGHPAEMADRPNVLIETPQTRAELCVVLAEFARRRIDLLAVDGGDGTVRDVLTCGVSVFGDNWPRLIVLPKGKTNALAVDLGLPNHWSLSEALEAATAGRTIERRPISVDLPPGSDDGSHPGHRVLGFILGGGVFTLSSETAQKAHGLGAFNAFAVGLTIAWTVLQTIFAGATNPFRRGTDMELRLGPNAQPLPISKHGRAGRRFFLLISTLTVFPPGITPYGRQRKGMKLLVIDAALRRLFPLFPLFVMGGNDRMARANGIHRTSTDVIELDLSDRFILDGEYFPAGHYHLTEGPRLRFVVP